MLWEFLIIFAVWQSKAHKSFEYKETRIYTETMTKAKKKADSIARVNHLDLAGVDIYRLGRVYRNVK